MQKLLGNCKKGVLVILSAPAGTGKSTLVKMLLKEFPEKIVKSCSYTTRKARNGEQDGVDYLFISKAEFQKKIKKNEFLEYATLYGNLYGTSKKSVNSALMQGKHVILVIDTQGMKQLKKQKGMISIFISPPSLSELKARLENRMTEDEIKISERLSWAKKELKLAKNYDFHFVNDDLSVAYQVLRSILIAEENKTK